MPDPTKLLEIKAIAVAAAQAGATIVMEYFERGVTMRTKTGSDKTYDLVSQADLDSEQAIAATIQAAFADHVILGEELHHGSADAEHLWIVDPIDGTNNFAHRIPQFAISVAYYRAGHPQVGVVLNPATGALYVAVAGQGATLNAQPIFVSRAAKINEAVIATGFFYDRGPMMQTTLDTMADLFRRDVHGLRRFGAASLDLCMVAAGQFDAFFEYNLAPWDFAAGRFILEQAGGRVTNCAGDALPIAHSSILASNSLLHAELMSVIGPYFGRLKQ